MAFRRLQTLALLAAAWLALPLSGDVARATPLPATSLVIDARAVVGGNFRSVKPRKAVRKHARHRHRGGIRRAVKHRACRRYRTCRALPAPREILASREQTPVSAAPASLRVPNPDRALSLPVQDPDADIVERERDIWIISSVATTLRGYDVEHAVSIVETRDLQTGTLSYRLIKGDASKRTRDSAELAEIRLAANERLVADLHNHPRVRTASRDLTEMSTARRMTRANFYPGIDDYAAVIKRGTVSAIVNPDSGVMLLRRINGAPSIRRIDGESLDALDESAAKRLELSYLYSQGYLKDGDWVRPAVALSLHAGR